MNHKLLAAIDTGLDRAAVTAGYNPATAGNLPQLIGRGIQALLGLLGIAFLIFLIWGGILWMVSGGDKEKVAKAQRMITNSAIAVVVILASFAIATYVISALVTATTIP